MHARAPGSSSNLGPGFDVLGLALSIYVEVTARPAAGLLIHSSGEGAELATDASHLAARVAREVLGHDRVELEVRSEIPLGRGLGSSAALAVATAAACGAPDPFSVAAGFDGHAENAAASALGGLVAGAMIDGRPVARRLPLDSRLGFVVLVPDRELSTEKARSVLPSSVPFADAVFNLGRLGLLVSGLADRSNLLAVAGEDRLHQPARASLFPEAASLCEGLKASGALTASWSGAGTSLIAICDSKQDADHVRAEGERLLAAAGVPGRALRLDADLDGVVVSSTT